MAIPILLGGPKRPAISWGDRGPLTDLEIFHYWPLELRLASFGVATVLGPRSTWLVVLDIDCNWMFPNCLWFFQHIWQRCPIVKTPSGGVHIYFRVEEEMRSLVLAKDPTSTRQMLAEVRASGALAIHPMSPPNIHKSEIPYLMQTMIPIQNAPFLSRGEWEPLFDYIRTFDRTPTKKDYSPIITKINNQTPDQTNRKDGDETPWAKFNRLYSFAELLKPKGWLEISPGNWSRPGKIDGGNSASVTVARDGNEILTVFTTSDPILKVGQKLNKAGCLTFLYFGGDYSAAGKYMFKILNGGRSNV